MRRRSVIASIGAIVGTSIGAAAYTSASTSRQATFSVASDSGTALIGLIAGTSSQITDNGDKLDVSIQNLNTDASFTFGDSAALGTDYAFSIKNNDSVSRSITIGYNTAGVTFKVYKAGGTTSPPSDWTTPTLQGTVDSATDVTISAAASEEFRVVMTVDTTGVASGATTLDGTLTFNAN